MSHWDEFEPPPRQYGKARLAQLAWFGSLLVLAAACFAFAQVSWPPVIALGVLYLACYANLMCVRCPRCARPYFRGRLLAWHPLASKCCHCGAP
jgi:hypothetical protein